MGDSVFARCCGRWKIYVWDDVFEPAICLKILCGACAFALGGIFEVDSAAVAYDFYDEF